MTTGNGASTFRRGVRRSARAPARRAPLALALAGLLGIWIVPALGAAEEVPIVGSETLIGDLIPITGDPIETRSVDLRIEFRRDSAEITERAAAQLRELGVALTSEALRNAELALYGHTDSSGPADYNRELSERRAKAVAAFLKEHFAIEDGLFREVRGYGEERPREDLPSGDAAQRRVEIATFHERAAESVDTIEAPGAAVADEPEQAMTLPETGDTAVPAIGEPALDTGTTESDDDDGQSQGGYVVIE